MMEKLKEFWIYNEYVIVDLMTIFGPAALFILVALLTA